MTPRQEKPEVILVVDGVECDAPEGMMLVDAAKRGDVEIPVFCYEPKLGAPVGACRMCLVEVEGIPKLQTACSTPVRDGMVVYTQTDRVQQAQSAVVEFLLVNHPLDCPVCDKGGECPLQDIAMGWGPGKSRFTDPKRHFQKPVPLSPLVRIDRERCILCYRCVRFSQEVAEDEQLQFLERGARTYVGTFDDRPYIAPFHGNIIELCPVGALTSEAYRFRARPWEIEQAGSICTLCPSQCNVRYTVRDERVQRVLARDNAEVDDGWLCDKGRFGFQMIASSDRLTGPMIRQAGALKGATWDEALDRVAQALREAGERAAAIVGGGASNEEGYLLQRILRQGLGSPHVDSGGGGAIERELLSELSSPELGAGIAEIDFADSVLVIGCDPMHAMPILDLRIRKVVRRMRTQLAVASDRPTALDGGTDETARYLPGEGAAFLASLAGALGAEGYPREAPEDVRELAAMLRPGSTVIVWGERLRQGPSGADALRALLACARALRAEQGGGLLEVPEATNARGLREVGCIPTAGPGLSEVEAGMNAAEIREALEAKQLTALVLWDVDPIRDLPDPQGWRRALGAAKFVVSVSMFGNESGGHADVCLPAESSAEKEGTMTHPDGRLQRLRPGVPHPGNVRAGWQVLAELSARLGHETGVDSAAEALEAIAREVPFYAGISHEEIGGQGVRWQQREAASSYPRPEAIGTRDEVPHPTPSDDRSPSAPSAAGPAAPTAPENKSDDILRFASGVVGPGRERGGRPDRSTRDSVPSPDEPGGNRLRLGTYRHLWSGEVPERNPALRFLVAKQTLELAPTDAAALGVSQGDQVEVRSNGASVRAKVAIRERMLPGAGFLIEGTARENANTLRGAEIVEVAKLGEERTG